ncbi:hypothetical protein GCM10022384_31120 [Streptomyces marokkonensis]|uniref:Probable transposase IS891/IS1136/IS1341 domain-containing protein n=1 Tax=Streptomyces marokkonensis TaxID=324855 RepID=A0ABP7QAS1_9ACTN
MATSASSWTPSRTSCVLSDGSKIDSPRFLRRAEKKLKRLQRELSRKAKESKNRAKARLKVANAARNILFEGRRIVAAGRAETPNACGAQVRRARVPAQPGEAGSPRKGHTTQAGFPGL